MARPPAGNDDELPWLAEGVREERATLVPRARLFGGGLLALALAGLVGVGVYLASSHKSDGSSGYARPEDAPLITADAGAYKIAPADPGGAPGGIDDALANTARGSDQGSAILPDEPEQPLARPSGTVAVTTAPPPASSPAPLPTDLLPPAARASATGTSAAGPPVAGPLAITSAPAKPVAPALTKPADFEPAAKARPRDNLPADAPAPTKPEAKVKVAGDATKPEAASAGGVTLQLGAFSTRDKAEAAWGKAGDEGALAGLTRRIEPVERDGATLYRLRAGGVASKEAARTLCARLHAAGDACIVAD